MTVLLYWNSCEKYRKKSINLFHNQRHHINHRSAPPLLTVSHYNLGRLDSQLPNALKIRTTPLLPQSLRIVKEPNIPPLEGHLLFRHRSQGGDSLQVGEDGGVFDVDEVEDYHEGEAVCGVDRGWG